MNIVERIKGIILKPKEEWQTIAGETTPIVDLYKNYIIILAAIGPVASFIGLSIVGISLPMVGIIQDTDSNRPAKRCRSVRSYPCWRICSRLHY